MCKKKQVAKRLEMFNGQNILPGFPEKMVQIVTFFNEKVAKGEFVLGDSIEAWNGKDDVIDELKLGYEADSYFYAIVLAHVATANDGNVDIPDGINVWRWAWPLNLLAESANWQPDFMARVIGSFVGKKDDIDGLLKNAVQTYARKDFEKGLLLREKLPDFETNISAGLMENDFQHYCDTFPPQQNERLFIEAYWLTSITEEKINEKAFDLVMDFEDFTSVSMMAFLMKLQRLLKDDKKATCEEKIRDVVKSGETVGYVNPFCNWAIRSDDNLPFVEEIALLMIEGLGQNNRGMLGAIDNAIALRDKDHESLVRIIVKVAEVFSPLDVLKMGRCLHRLNEEKEMFVELAVLFIIHPNAEYRLTGRRLWDEYHLESSEFDVAEMDEAAQCAFAFSMLQDCGNPETRLPKVLPLIKSKNKKVKRFVMNVLRPYTDDYMGHVCAALDKLKIKGKESKMIKEYVDGRWNVIQVRKKTKELWPSFAYGKAYKEARRVESEHIQNKLKEAEENHPSVWKELAKTVVLARGGGWRNADGTTQKLPLIQFSAPARQLAESLSPREQETWINDLLKSWDDTAGNH